MAADAATLAPLANGRDDLDRLNDALGRTGDPLDPMAEVGMSNPLKEQASSGTRRLNLVSERSGVHTICILQVRIPVNGRSQSPRRCTTGCNVSPRTPALVHSPRKSMM